VKNNHTPEIRFPGYIGDWEERKIGEFLTESRISGTNGLEAKKLTVKLWGKGVVPKNEIYQGSEATKYYIRKAGQFIYGKLDFLHQAFGIIPDKLDGYESTLDSPAFDIAENLNSSFFLEHVSRKQFYLYQGTIANGSRKAKRIHSETFFEMPLIVPTMEEQKKIGDFFEKIDQTIALHQQELTTLKQTKQGFLQKMFPKEGESVPEVRFPGFTGDWKERKLINNIIEKVLDFRGKSPAKFGMRWGNSGYLVLSALNVKNGYIDKQVEAKYGDQTLFERWMGKERLEKGDVVFTTEAPLGNVAQVPDDNGYILNQRAVAFKTSTEKTDNNFLAQLLRSPLFQTKLKANASGGTAKGIGMKEFAKMSATIPVSVEEQIKIGNFFKQLDDTISLQQRELDALKETKKAFLQKMFV